MLLVFGLLSVVGLAASDLITQGPVNKTKTYNSASAPREDVSFRCVFDSSEDISIQWIKSASELFTSSDYMISTSVNSSTLTIFNATTSDIDAYTCSANTSNSSDAITAYLTVVELVFITKHPSSKTANQGSSVKFSCDATGFPLPNFTWKRDNTEIGNSTRTRYSSDRKELFISGIQQSDAGNYTCEVSQLSYPPKQSTTAVFTVYYIAEPVLEPNATNVALVEGGTVNIHCSSNSLPVAEIKWINASNAIIENSKSLAFNPVSRNDAGSYYCNASNAAGTTRSEAVSIEVYYLDQPVLNSSTNAVLSIIEGSYLSVMCSSMANPSAQYRWTSSSGEIVSSTHSLVFPNINRASAKTYTCVAHNSAGLQKNSSLTIDVQYLDDPTFNTSSPNTVIEGSYLSVVCNSVANPNTQYRWTSLSGEIVSNARYLVFPNIHRNDSRTYTCIANNSAGLQKNSSLTIDVQYLDEPTFNTSANAVSVIEGRYLSVMCSSMANPNTQYRWTYSSGESISNTRYLVFPNIHRNDSRTYTCIANNSAGLQKTSTLTVDVQYLDDPTFNTSSPNTVSIIEGSYLSFVCNSVANPNTQYRWTSPSGEIVSNTHSLVFPNINRASANTYTCVANNSAGLQKNSSLTIDVQYLDDPTFNTSSPNTVIEGSYLSVVCNSVANPNTQYRWTSLSGEIVSNARYLVFPNIHRNDSRTYTCIANNSAGLQKNSSLTIDVQYLDEPTFNTSANAVSVIEGRYLSVMCSSMANPNTQYRWTFSSGESISNTRYLVFPNIHRNDSRTYTCIANNSAGLQKTSTLTIDVQYIDAPTTNLSSATVTLNETDKFVIECSSVSHPAATYQWTSPSGSALNSPILSFAGIVRSQVGSYTCTAANVAGEKSLVVSIVINYLDKPLLNSTSLAKINETMSLVNVTEGNPLRVTCSAMSLPQASYTWSMYQDSSFSSNGKDLLFNSILRSNSGTYDCLARNSFGSKRSGALTVNVQYIDKPMLNDSNIIIVEGSPLNIQCVSVANPSASYEWIKKDGSIVTTSQVLSFASIHRNDTTSYACRANNSITSKQSKFIEIEVQSIDQPIFNSSKSLVIEEGQSITISCYSTAYPINAFKWETYTGIIVSNSSYLRFSPINRTDDNVYRCIGTNSAGTKKSLNLTVTVQYKPTLLFNASATLPFVAIGTTVTLSCIVESEPVAKVALKHETLVLKSRVGGFSYSFTLQRSSSGSYSCDANNSVGHTSVQKEIRVQEPPVEPQNFRVSQKGSRWILVEWQKPLFDGNDKITSYNLQVNTSQNVAIYNISEMIMHKNVTNLQPFQNYTFILRAVNGRGPGKQIAIKNGTETEAPPLPNRTTVSSSSSSYHSVTVKLPKFANTYGEIKYYRVVVVKWRQSLQDPKFYKNLKGFADPNTPYITAEFSAEYFGSRSEIDFVIGDGTATSRAKTTSRVRRAAPQDYHNQPLEEDSHYAGFLRAFVDDQTSSEIPWFTFKTSKKGTGLSGGAIAGIVIGVILLIVLVAFVAFYVRRRSQGYEEADVDDRKSRRPSFFRGGSHKPVAADPNDPIPLDALEKHVNGLKANSNYGFSQEYAKFDKKLKHPCTYSANSVNSLKNRYANIHAYDHSRVVLQGDGSPGSDFINANYIRGFNGDEEYIAAQGPLPETISDFWRMVWEKSCSTIVMLTNCIENGRPKCAQYWPTQGSLTFKDIVVTSMEILEFPDHVVRNFHLTRAGKSLERTVKQFHYISWPDHGVPSDHTALFSVIKKVNRWRSMAPEKAPLVVHCSAGVGRTGTYIVLDSQINRIRNGMDVNVYSNVQLLRDSRYLMVQTEDQYAYIHQALVEFIKSGDTEIDASELRDYIRRKSDIDPNTGSTGMMDEFVALARTNSQLTFTEANKPANHTKNRYKNVYPYDSTRVLLSQMHGHAGSDYINANHIDGYIDVGAFIATQAPLPTTFADFWRMIWETDSRTIVMLSKEQEGGKVKVHCYWPTEGSIKIGLWIIELLKTSTYTEYILRELKLTNSEGKSVIVNHYQYTAWPESGPPDSAFGIIDLLGQVSKWNSTIGNRVITVHCSAGVGRTGVFIALTNLIERLKTEAVVDVYQTVKRLRLQRTAMVQTKDQYEFCYQALQEYLDSFDHYSNFE